MDDGSYDGSFGSIQSFIRSINILYQSKIDIFLPANREISNIIYKIENIKGCRQEPEAKAAASPDPGPQPPDTSPHRALLVGVHPGARSAAVSLRKLH